MILRVRFVLPLFAALCLALPGGATPCQAQALTLPDAPLPSMLQAGDAVLHAAGEGSVQGEVTDMNGSLVPGATVLLVPASGSAPLTATSDSGGYFILHHVPPTTYTAKVTATGFSGFQTAPFTLRPGEHFELPTVALPIPANHADVTVTMSESQLAQYEMRAAEQQRVLGFPNFYTSFVWDPAPMNAKQKFDLAAHSVLDPSAFITTAIVAGIEQLRGTFPRYDSGAAGYGERYGAAYGDALLGRILGSAVMPAIFHQDPRYFYQGTGTRKSRAWHAIESAVICRGDSGHREFNISHIAGNAAAGAISATYHPGENAGRLAGLNALIGIGGSAGVNLVREFALNHFTHHKPAYGKGKPPEEE
jgi:hypothetical protein